jgi:hypothetical protein
MKRIFSVDSVAQALNKSNPPSLVITATGTANTGGWKNFALVPLWNRTNPPVNGVYEFSFEGVSPTGIVTQVLTPTGPVSYVLSPDETKDIQRFVVYAGSNYIRSEWDQPVPLSAEDNNLHDQPRSATGYSSNWELAEAFRDAIRNLPPDPHPYPDKLYQFTIVHLGAEIGGLAGLDRMKVTVQA